MRPSGTSMRSSIARMAFSTKPSAAGVTAFAPREPTRRRSCRRNTRRQWRRATCCPCQSQPNSPTIFFKRKGALAGRPQSHRDVLEDRLRRVVHLELDRVRGVLEADHLAHLQVDVAVDEVVVEHAAGFEELVILVQALERLAQRAA